MTGVDHDGETLAALVRRIRGPVSQRRWAEQTGLGLGWVKMVETGETETGETERLTRPKFELLVAIEGLVDGDREALERFVTDTKASLAERLTRLEKQQARMEAMLEEILGRLPDAGAPPP